MEIIWTRYAIERQREWEKKRGITRQEVEGVLRNPEQVVPGDRNVLVAQARRGNGLLRVPFIGIEGERKVLTVYLDKPSGEILEGVAGCAYDMTLKRMSFSCSSVTILWWMRWRSPGGDRELWRGWGARQWGVP